MVVLGAAAASNSTFAGWSGSGCSGTGTCPVTLNADKSVTATFNLLPPPANDNFADRFVLPGASASANGTTVAAPGAVSRPRGQRGWTLRLVDVDRSLDGHCDDPHPG
jgi:hypothetical protein